VTAKAASPLPRSGVVVASRADAVSVKFDYDPRYGPDEPVLISAEIGVERAAASGRFVAASGQTAVFQLDSQWRPGGSPLAPARDGVRAEARSTLGQSRQRATVTNATERGATIEVAFKPGGSQIDLLVELASYSATLPCRVVSTSDAGDHLLMLLEFRDLTTAQRAFVRRLVNLFGNLGRLGAARIAV
jgi:hypothetical protein